MKLVQSPQIALMRRLRESPHLIRPDDHQSAIILMLLFILLAACIQNYKEDNNCVNLFSWTGNVPVFLEYFNPKFSNVEQCMIKCTTVPQKNSFNRIWIDVKKYMRLQSLFSQSVVLVCRCSTLSTLWTPKMQVWYFFFYAEFSAFRKTLLQHHGFLPSNLLFSV
jgi:hypothetical protein